MKIERRLERLERDFQTGSTTLVFADGRTAILPGTGDYLLRLLGVAGSPESANHVQVAHLELIRSSVGSNEPGGGHLIDLIRCLLLGPVCTQKA
jgi:hypothetical protein